MTGNIVRVVLGALLSYWISNATGTPFWMSAIAVAGIYFLVMHGGGTTTAHAGGRGIGGMFTGAGRLVVAYAVYTGLMMVGTYFIGVSNNYATHEFQVLGWRPWLWPSGVAPDLLLWVCLAFIATGIADRASHGNTRLAGMIFVGAAIVIASMKYYPETTEEVIPVGPVAIAATDHRAHEEGIPVIAVKAIGRGVFGTKEREGVLVTKWNQTRKFLFGAPAPATAPATPRVVYVSAPAPARPTAKFHPFSADGCYEKDLGYTAQWSPNKGGMRVYDPTGGSHVERLGQKSTISAFGPGTWKFCAEDPDPAGGVVIWE